MPGARDRDRQNISNNENVVRIADVTQTNVRRNGRGYQEQIQIMATAIGKPMPKAAAIVDANAKSKSSSGCTLSSSGMAYSTNRRAKKPSPGRSDKRLSGSPTLCSEAPTAKGCLKMVNKVLIAVMS